MSELRRLERIVVKANDPSEAATVWRETLALDGGSAEVRAGDIVVEMRSAREGESEGLSKLVIAVEDLADMLGRLQAMGMSLDPSWTGGDIELIERRD